ncbi:diguanylate cyclase domain-containing protein [Egicoccus sp. AB-alg6-2]|uniref:diguanylate cyclase domain-containing protein n=1 Tax=Egicoccus sp. AB-alg6-2 TaxID=3242692 RepID=UPI00359E327E
MLDTREAPGGAQLVERFRRLFGLFTLAMSACIVVQILDVAPRLWPGAALAACGLAAWAHAMQRWGDRSLLVDVTVFVPLAATGILFDNHLYLFPLLFVTAFQRGFHATARRAYVLALVSVVVWELARAQVGEVPRPGTAVALGVMLVVATSFARVVRRTAERSDRAARREHRLLQSVVALTHVSDPSDIFEEVARTGVDLTEIPGAIAVVWEAADDEFRAVASTRGNRGNGVQAAVLPGQVLRVFELGRPVVLDGQVARELQHVGESTPFYPAYVMVPLPRAERPRAAVLLYCPDHPDDDLLELLHRFAVEVGLAEERVVLLSKLAAREARLSSIINHSSDVIALLDQVGCITMVNPAGEQRFGHRNEDVLGRSVFELVHPEDRESVQEAMRGIFTAESVEIACRFRTASGEWRDVESQMTARDGGGFVLNARDVTERKALEAEIVHRAFHDPLTGLANRALFFDRLQHAVERSKRTHVPVAVLMIDLDDFKPVNDTYGHQVGDALLVEVARRLETTVRQIDTPARIGGDEFAVLIEEAADLGELALLAERLHEQLRLPAQVGSVSLTMSASVGGATSTFGETHDNLMRRADEALYSVKYSGKDRVRLVGPDDLRLLADAAAPVADGTVSR